MIQYSYLTQLRILIKKHEKENFNWSSRDRDSISGSI